jgi:hypothetical protein
MAENRKERIEHLKKELKIRRGLAECNARFAKKIAWQIRVLEGAEKCP